MTFTQLTLDQFFFLSREIKVSDDLNNDLDVCDWPATFIRALLTYYWTASLCSVPADLKALVYHFGIVTGGEKEWNFAYDQFKTTTVISDKNTLLYAMAGSQQPWIIQR